MQSYQHNPWLVHLAGKLLVNDPQVTELIAHNPFEGAAPPRLANKLYTPVDPIV